MCNRLVKMLWSGAEKHLSHSPCGNGRTPSCFERDPVMEMYLVAPDQSNTEQFKWLLSPIIKSTAYISVSSLPVPFLPLLKNPHRLTNINEKYFWSEIKP